MTWISHLLPEDPLNAIREKYNDNSEVFMKYAVCHDYYLYLQILARRLDKEQQRSHRLLKQMAIAFRAKSEKKMLRIAEQHFDVDRSIKLYNESIILFSRILLDKVSALVEVLIGRIRNGDYDFTKHKEYFVKEKNMHYNRSYSKLLEVSKWYDNFSLIRNKMVQHGGQRYTSLIHSDGGLLPIAEGKTSGMLDSNSLVILRKIVLKYAPMYYERFKNYRQDATFPNTSTCK